MVFLNMRITILTRLKAHQTNPADINFTMYTCNLIATSIFENVKPAFRTFFASIHFSIFHEQFVRCSVFKIITRLMIVVLHITFDTIVNSTAVTMELVFIIFFNQVHYRLALFLNTILVLARVLLDENVGTH